MSTVVDGPRRSVQAPLLEGRDLGKSYGSSTVLNGVHLTLEEGEVHAVVGENGAGKSTLMKIIAGVIPAGDFQGTLLLRGAPVEFSSPQASDEAGIVMVPQELHVVPHLSIAENMFAAQLPGRRGMYDERAAVRQARAALGIFGLRSDPRGPAAGLTPSERRLTVLAAALHRSARLLILDEPTAAMTDSETSVLMEHLQVVRESGCGILYITHRLDDLDQFADKVLVLRNGLPVANFSSVPPRDQLVGAMLGTARASFEALAHQPASTGEPGPPVLRVRDLSVHSPGGAGRPRVQDANLELRPGEIVGLYGLVGAGRSELARALFGTWPGQVTGECTIAAQDGIPKKPHRAISRGLMLLAEDRKSQGVFHGQSVSSNLTTTMLNALSTARFFVDRRAEAAHVRQLITRLGVRPARAEARIDALSGGNQQKVLLGRCLFDGLRVLILDEPTLGVDIGARQDIYKMIRSIAGDLGVAVLLISSDVDEILAEADRTLVMYKGRIRSEFPRGVSAHELLSAATGAS